MGTLLSAAIAVIAGMAVATGAVVGVVKTVKEDPKPPAGASQGLADLPIVNYGDKSRLRSSEAGQRKRWPALLLPVARSGPGRSRARSPTR